MFSPDQVATAWGKNRRFVLDRLKPGELWPIKRLSRKTILIPQSTLDAYLRRTQAGAQ